MTHFVISEEFDSSLFLAIANLDDKYRRNIRPDMMKDGTSELLNWVSASGCLFQTHLSGQRIDYVPGYRSKAGTGTAQGFVVWK